MTSMFTKNEDKYLHYLSKKEDPKPYMVGYNLGLSPDQTISVISNLEKQRPPPLIEGDSSTLELTDKGKEFISHPTK